MPDMEKVIKGLEVCTSIEDGESCPKECPYYQDVCYGYDQLMRDALKLLKEQEAVEPELEGGGSTWWHVCGECHGAIDASDRYCKHCGRRIKHEKKAE